MRDRFLNSVATGAIAAVAAGAVVVSLGAQTVAEGPSVTTLKTPWGEPDLQGIWTTEFDVPLQRPAKYAGQEILDRGTASRIGQRARNAWGKAAGRP